MLQMRVAKWRSRVGREAMNGLGVPGKARIFNRKLFFLPRAACPGAEWQGLLDAIPFSADLRRRPSCPKCQASTGI
jgi:hypothetical protein